MLFALAAALGSTCPNEAYPQVTCESEGLCSAMRNPIVDESGCTSKCTTSTPPADVKASWNSRTCSCTQLDEQKQPEACSFACCGDAPTPAPPTPTPTPPTPTPTPTPPTPTPTSNPTVLPDCGFTAKDGTVYNFSPLKGERTYGTLAGASYTFQMCAPTVGACGTPGATALLTSNDAANGCLIVEEWAAGPTLAWNTEASTTPATVTLNVANGFACSQAGSVDGKFALTVVFTCTNSSLLPPGDAFTITQEDQCSASIAFPTSAACTGGTTPAPTATPPAAGCCGGGLPKDCAFDGNVGPHSACASAASRCLCCGARSPAPAGG